MIGLNIALSMLNLSTCGAWGFLDFFAETERRGRAHLEPTGVSRAAEQVFFYTVSIR